MGPVLVFLFEVLQTFLKLGHFHELDQPVLLLFQMRKVSVVVALINFLIFQTELKVFGQLQRLVHFDLPFALSFHQLIA